MKIIHKIDDFLISLFPELKGKKDDKLVEVVETYYSVDGIKPVVTIEGEYLIIDIDIERFITDDKEYKKALEFCERGEFSHAKPILNSLIHKNPTNSEYHRVLGQVLSEEGNQDDAIDSLISALRWDSKNNWALVMMGNIFAKYKDDIETAKKYYDQALVINPNDHITMNNIGANLMQQGKNKEAKEYFSQALKINEEYPNTHYALAFISYQEERFAEAFEYAITSIKLNNSKNDLLYNSINLVFDISKKVLPSDIGKKTYKNYLHQLEFEGDRGIEILTDENIPTAAKFEFAENYKRDKHRVIYNPKHLAVEHLIVHELVHLELVIQAREEGINQVFYSNDANKENFYSFLNPVIKSYRKKGIPEETITAVCNDLFDGLNRQVFNTPIDLFIEDIIFSRFADFRPYQFLSLYDMIQQGVKAVTDKEIVKLAPKEVLSKSKIYNLVNALQFKDLYGIDLIHLFKAIPAELKQAQRFFEEFQEYRYDKKPAEEYEIIVNWSEDLSLDKFYELEGEIQFRRRRNIDKLFDSLQNDPLGLKERDPVKEREMKRFQEAEAELGLNMAVVMFMVDALNYFENKDKEAVKKIALEIAMLGTLGFRPERKDYSLDSIPKKRFSGYHILAYYYVSWAIAIPEMLKELQLPYDEEYKMALTMRKPK